MRTDARRPGLDLLRGVAALGVLVSHVAFATGIVNPARWGSELRLLLPRLDVGVPIFFVLSGLLISRPFLRAVADGAPAPRPARYLLRRAARIYPLYWLVLAVSLAGIGSAVAFPDGLPSVPRLLSFLTLTHIYRPATAIGPITQSWSLATEISFYLVVPVWFGLCRRVLDRRGVTDRDARLRWMLGALVSWVAVALAWRGLVVVATDTFDYTVPGAIDVRGAYLTWLPNHLDNFGAGVALALVAELRRDRLAVPLAARLGAYAAAAVALWVVATRLDLPPLHTGFDGPQTFGRHVLFLAIAALVVAPSALAATTPRFVLQDGRDAARAAGQNVVGRLASAVGLGSYGVYLWHQWVEEQWFERRGYPDFQAPFPTTLAAVVGGSALLAGVGYWAWERWPQRMVDAVDRARSGRRPGDPPPRSLGASPTLDGLRGLSILAVMATHVVFVYPERPEWMLRGGFLGVDVFLVLSGFLICGTLLRERDRTGTVDLRAFLGRRARRLLPPMLAFLALHAVVVAIIGDSLKEEALQALMAATFLGNWQLTFGHHPPFDLVHLWSLAVEGQLYVLCGLAVWWGRRRIDETAGVVWVLVGAGLAVAVWRLVGYRLGADAEALYERTDARADSMIIGALGAVLWRARLVPDHVARRAGVVAGLAIVAAWWVVPPRSAALFGGGFTVMAAAVVALVLAALVAERSPVATVAGWAPLRAVGRMSYSLYLWHLPIYVWVLRGLPDLAPGLRYALAVSASFAVAGVSYALIERPLLSRRHSGVGPDRQTESTAPPVAETR